MFTLSIWSLLPLKARFIQCSGIGSNSVQLLILDLSIYICFYHDVPLANCLSV